MAHSKTRIWNMGMAAIGDIEIEDFDAVGESARLARLLYAELRDAVLEEFPWQFASTRLTIASQSTAPDWGWQLAYPVPADYLRLDQLSGDKDYDWDVESVGGKRCIVTDLGSPINIRYIYRITDTSQYSALFTQALAARIAMETGETLGKSQKVLENQARLYTNKLKLARQVRSQERTPAVISASEWDDARRRGGAQTLAKLDGDPQPL